MRLLVCIVITHTNPKRFKTQLLWNLVNRWSMNNCVISQNALCTCTRNWFVALVVKSVHLTYPTLRITVQTTSKCHKSSDSFNAHEQTVNRLNWHTLIIKFGAFCKQIFAASINTIAMKIMWLKKFGPKPWFGQLMWNELQVFLFHCWICFWKCIL